MSAHAGVVQFGLMSHTVFVSFAEDVDWIVARTYKPLDDTVLRARMHPVRVQGHSLVLENVGTYLHCSGGRDRSRREQLYHARMDHPQYRRHAQPYTYVRAACNVDCICASSDAARMERLEPVYMCCAALACPRLKLPVLRDACKDPRR